MFNWREHLEIHPAAEPFPLMSPAELKELADDTMKNGIKAPIVIWEPGARRGVLRDFRQPPKTALVLRSKHCSGKNRAAR
jgi:hypothetical protein